MEKIDIARDAGYDGIELWINELEEVERDGPGVEELRRILDDKGLFVPNIIGLWNAMPPEEEAWAQALEESKRRMDLCARVGAQHVAAIPQPDRPDIDLMWAAEKYRALLDAGQEMGITVAVEFIGFFQGVNRLGQATAIALEARHPSACMVADTFHCFRGGSMFEGLQHIQGSLIAVMHFNDVPGDVPREEQGDEHRLLPGDGILPLVEVVQTLAAIGFPGPLSLEIFNRELWEQDPLEVAKEGVRRIHRIMDNAGVGHSPGPDERITEPGVF
jgi:sugar phosphate isomerase/epimerase